jgi:DUF2911 family protein
MRRHLLATTLAVVVLTLSVVVAQTNRPASPAGTAATQVLGKYATVPGADGPQYQNGKWIEITYGRPIKRGRDLWGSGADYGKTVTDGAPLWRAGANQTTTLKSDVPLVINGKTLAPGEYHLLIDLKPNAWTLVVTTQPSQTTYNANNKTDLWGAFNYKPDKDVVRAPMTLGTLPVSVDQLTWVFTDMSDAGGKLTIMWDKTMASVSFKVGN